jgi:hypothetical protein
MAPSTVGMAFVDLGRTSTIRGCQWLGAWLATWLNRNLGMLRIKRISLKRTETM